MVSAIQTVPGAYITSQIVSPAVVSSSVNLGVSQLAFPSTSLGLDTTRAVPLAYNAAGGLDTTSSSGSMTDNQSNSTQASVVTTNAAQDAASIKLAADLAASTIAENLAVLDKAFDDALARQLLVNTRAAAAALAATDAANVRLAATQARIEANREIELDRQAIAANNAISLDALFAAKGNETNAENAVNARQDAVAQTDRATALQSIGALAQPIANESSTVTNTTPATTARVVPASNTTTDKPANNSEATNSLVAQNYASLAASSGLSPSVIATPVTPEDVAAAFAIPSITDLAQSAVATPVVTTSKDKASETDRAATLPSVTPLPITNASATVASTLPATVSNVVAASNATTNSPIRSAEAVNRPVLNPEIDAAVQAVITVAQNPAYANLVAGSYVSMAAASAQSPSATFTPMRLEEIKPIISIPAITALSQLGAQYGRDGNPSWSYRQRAAIVNVRARPARAAI